MLEDKNNKMIAVNHNRNIKQVFDLSLMQSISTSLLSAECTRDVHFSAIT